MTHILVVGNYDSFTYNLVQYVGETVSEMQGGDENTDGSSSDGSDDVLVYRNDAPSTDDVCDINPGGIVVLPGPGTPTEAGVSVSVFRNLDYPTLDVYLSHQSLCAALGSHVGRVSHAVHGKPSFVGHDGAGVSSRLLGQIKVDHYHLLAVEHEGVPPELAVTAYTVAERSEAEDSDGDTGIEGGEPVVVMGVHHREKLYVGVQFHPGSILTDSGKNVIRNFVTFVVGDGPAAAAWGGEQ